MEDYNQLITFFEKMQKLIRINVEQAIYEFEKNNHEQRSPQTDTLAMALAKARKEFKDLSFNRMNLATLMPYTDLNALYRATRDALAQYEIVVIQKTVERKERLYLVSMLCHSSGQWIETRTPIGYPDTDIKRFTTVLNEHKKQHLMDLLGIAPNGYEYDDDGQALEELRRAEVNKGTSKDYTRKQKKNDVYECISEQQLTELSRMLNEDDIVDIYDEILRMFGLEKLSELPVSKYRLVYNRINEIKAARRKI